MTHTKDEALEARNKPFEVTEETRQRIAADHELFLKFHHADPKPLGFVGSYEYGDSYTKGMSCTPSVDRPHPVYRASPSRMTTLEWQNDPRTQELMAVIRALSALSTPPAAQRQWVGLTFAEICECENGYYLFARAIEAKLKEKNT